MQFRNQVALMALAASSATQSSAFYLDSLNKGNHGYSPFSYVDQPVEIGHMDESLQRQQEAPENGLDREMEQVVNMNLATSALQGLQQQFCQPQVDSVPESPPAEHLDFPESKIRDEYSWWCAKYTKQFDESRYPIFRENWIRQEEYGRTTGQYFWLNEYGDCTQEEYASIMATSQQEESAEKLDNGLDREMEQVVNLNLATTAFQGLREQHRQQQQQQQQQPPPHKLVPVASSPPQLEPSPAKVQAHPGFPESKIREEYSLWCAKYSKEVDATRYPIFRENWIRQEEHDQKTGQHFWLNEYGDRTREEYMAIMNGKSVASPSPSPSSFQTVTVAQPEEDPMAAYAAAIAAANGSNIGNTVPSSPTPPSVEASSAGKTSFTATTTSQTQQENRDSSGLSDYLKQMASQGIGKINNTQGQRASPATTVQQNASMLMNLAKEAAEKFLGDTSDSFGLVTRQVGNFVPSHKMTEPRNGGHNKNGL